MVRAVVYAARTGQGWEARYSVAWEVDTAYWDGKAAELIRLREPLPLGLAEAVCGRLKEAIRAGGGGWTAERLAGELRRTAELAWGLAEKSETPGQRVRYSAVQPKLHWEVEEHRFGERMVPVSAKREVQGPSCCQRDKPAEAEPLEQAARLAADCMRGRSLLREEAAAMLAEAAPALASGAAALRALQLAALRCGVRLAAAIAPAGAAMAPIGAEAADGAAAAARRRLRLRRRRQELRCRRCGSGEERMRRTPCASCGRSGCAVCEACAALGRSRECGLLVLGPEPSEQPMALAPGAAMDRWGLSPAQQDASAAAVRFLRENALRAAEAATAAERSRRPDASRRPHRYTAEAAIYRPRSPAAAVRRRLLSLGSTAVQRISGLSGNDAYSHSFLLWAVTGAGKTEMIFPLLDAVLRGGGRALVATPRRDVVLELAPRLAKAFPDYSRAVLYGGSEDRWANADLTLATTHQLMRFQGAFDLVLIDELDAFPYHNDPLLHHAAAKSRKPAGAAVLLSATPPASMQRAVKRGRLSCARVPVRYHRHPLPVPGRIPLPPLHRWAGQSKGKLPAALGKQLKHSAARNAQLFVFVPYIRHVQPLVDLLRREAGRLGLDPAAIGGTSSTDPDRAAKVGAFRRAGLRLLVTTTILERGVTIPRSDVFILDAHHAMFNEAALVQMAGRAGRSGDDPNGRVFFCAAYRTSFQRGAERQIRMMNRIARRRGYLLTEGAAQ